MKKLFTLVALLTVFMGANAANWNKVKEINFSDYTGFPHYVMGYVPEWVDGVMTDYGANYRYETQENLDGDGDGRLKDGESVVGSTTTNGGAVYQKVTGAGPYWHQYFAVTGIPTQMDGHYKVVAKVKATEAASVNGQFRWSWSADPLNVTATVPASDEFVEVEWEYDGVGGTACDFIAQPGTSTATIEWESITVYEDQEGSRPSVWQQWLTNDGKPIIPDVATESKYVGDAEFGAWPAWAMEETGGINATWRGENSNKICAYSLTMGSNFDDQCPAEISGDSYRARPYPTAIEAEEGNESNHVFAVHVTQIDQIGDDAASIAWSNQFWVMAPTAFKSGLSVRIKFRYKAEHACSAGTQWHSKYPSIYLHWQAMGDVNFTETWQEFDKTATIPAEANNASSLAFNLCSDEANGRTPNVFYFDDLSWESMVLDEGYFISGINTNVTTKYEYLNDAIPFEDGVDVEGSKCLVATVGTKGKDETWVNQVMISTVRGDNGAFMASTLKPTGKIKNDPTDWNEYAASNLAKLDLPGLGVWTVYLDTDYSSMAFQMIEGQEEEEKEPVAIYTYADEIVVNGLERDDIKDDDHPEGTGAAWDNQFFIAANHTLKAGDKTHISFSYKRSGYQGAAENVTSGTQSHNEPGQYIHWAAIGSFTFTDEWQDFDADFEIPSQCDGSDNAGGYKNDFKSIAFNMAEVKEACNYHFKDVQWYMVDASLDAGMTYENLISGSTNFYKKEGAGTNPYTGITNVTAKNAKVSTATYNIAGQRVNKDYKGLVVKDGKKIVRK